MRNLTVSHGALAVAATVGFNIAAAVWATNTWQIALHLGIAAFLVSVPLFALEERTRDGRF